MGKLLPVDYYAADDEFWAAHLDCVWGYDGDENLFATEIDEYIDYVYADGDLEGMVEICAYRHAVIDEATRRQLADSTLDGLLDLMDQMFGSQEPGTTTQPTEGMCTAARAMVGAVVAEYHVWRCEVVAVVTVDVTRWARENGFADDEGES